MIWITMEKIVREMDPRTLPTYMVYVESIILTRSVILYAFVNDIQLNQTSINVNAPHHK